MRTLVVSDLHLGRQERTDLLRRPDLQQPLLDALDDVDRFVILGDGLELREAAHRDAIEVAGPFFRAVGERLGPDKPFVITAGNHDHGLAADDLADEYGDRIRKGFPDIPRRVSGFALDALLPENGFDVAKAVGEKLGVPVEFVETPWDSIFAALEANRFDVVANQVTINPERQAKYDLSQPYTVGEGVIVTRADDNTITTLADVRGKTAAENAMRLLAAGGRT